MKLTFTIIALGLAALSVIGCGSSGLSENTNNPGAHPQGMGPFDSRGNYVEDWADNPSKWKRSSKPDRTPEPEIQVDDPPMIAQSEQPPPSSVPLSSSPSRVASSSSSSVTKTTSTSTAKPKPKPVVAKAKPKAKAPAATRYTVKKGDTLSKIASRNKTTVTAIQRANGLSGSLIQIGKVLVIPKY